jgi:hypothetical protein
VEIVDSMRVQAKAHRPGARRLPPVVPVEVV